MDKTMNTSRISNSIKTTIEPKTTSNSLSNSLSTKSMMMNNEYVNQIALKIKNNMSSPLMKYMMFAIPVIILMGYFIYKYRFNYRALQSISQMNYKSKITLANLKTCSDVDKSLQYKLCDYYMLSSYMTPCVGNQHYDYVSQEMITEVLQSGARYIQIPICESDLTPNAVPVIGTAEYGQRLITSLNTLDIRPVFNAIRANAFNISNTKINYPLFIHLILNTNNPYTLGILADTIREILADKLINTDNYTAKFPIFLDKLCNLLNKIIIIATPEYKGTKLESYVVPTNILFESYYYGDLDSMNNPQSSAYTNTYNNKLSTKEQIASNKRFKTKYPSLDYVINNSSSIGKTILEDKEILNNLTNFNKVGMTIIKPHQPADVLSANYDPTSAIYNGCQWITMNFQVNDDHMKNYLKIFQSHSSSFVLKPASMRFSLEEESIPDLAQVYKAVSPTNSRIIDLYPTLNNRLIALESYSMPGMYLTQVESLLRFNVGSNIIQDKFGNKTYKIGLNQAFLVLKSTVSTGTRDIPMFLLSTNYKNLLISQNGSTFNLDEQKKTKPELYLQSFVFEKSISASEDSNENQYMLRTISIENPMYLANQNKVPKTYAYSSVVESQANMAYKIHLIPFQMQIYVTTLYDGSMKTMSGGIVGILEDNLRDGTHYIIESNTSTNNSSNNNFNYLKDQFYIKNPITNTYLIYDLTSRYIYDKSTAKPGSNGIFKLEQTNGFYSLFNSVNQVLVLFKNNLLKFVDVSSIASNENLFKVDISYIL